MVVTGAVPNGLESGSPTLFKRRIALELRQCRAAAGLVQKDAANRLDRTPQHIANLEGGIRLPSTGDLELLLDLYGVRDRIPFMRELLTAARKSTSWWTAFSGAIPDWFDLYLGLEAGAAELSSFDAILVPGLLQTVEYAEAVIRADTDLTEDEVRQRVELRMARQHILEREQEPVRLWTVLDESVLYRILGDSEVMREQLNHLLTMSQRPRTDIQVLPRNAGAHSAQQGGTFQLMKFPSDMAGDPGVVYHEQMGAGLYYENPDTIACYERALREVHALAATREDSRSKIEQAIKEVRT